MDEIGTPFCICVDFETKENETVTIRERDAMTQVRVKLDEVAAWIEKRCSSERVDG